MDIVYLLTPFVAWILAGLLKFGINSVKAGSLAFSQIGYGGLPSNHSAIVTSMVCLIALREGVASPEFGIAVTVAFIVILDASSLRAQVGKHAIAINRLYTGNKEHENLRERIGHSRLEIIAGVIVGMLVGWSIHTIF